MKPRREGLPFPPPKLPPFLKAAGREDIRIREPMEKTLPRLNGGRYG
jgi:hypothetical protein